MKQFLFLSLFLFGILYSELSFSQTNSFINYGTLGSSATGDRAYHSLVADLDGDGSQDILFVDEATGQYRFYPNDGAGNFSSYSYILPGVTWVGLVAGDIDNDGDIDLVGTNGRIYINNGALNFTQLGNLTIKQGTGSIGALKIVDINLDGKQDIVWANSGASATDMNEIWLNTGTTGNANFAYSTGFSSTSVGGRRNSIDVGDIDGDGDLDIVTGSVSYGSEVLKNNGGVFTHSQFPTGYGGGVRLVDWDQDGDLDILGYDPYNGFGLSFRRNDGTGNFANYISLFSNTQSLPTGWNLQGGSNGLVLGDVNGDGLLDAVVDRWGGGARVLINTGCQMILQSYALGNSSHGVRLADFNNDGKIDVFCAARDAASTIWKNDLTTVVAVPLSNITSVVNGTRAGTGTVNLSATASHSGTIKWWSAPSGGALLATGLTYTTPSISTATTYYVDATNANGCVSGRMPVTASIATPGAALNFDGVNDYASIANPFYEYSKEITVEWWVNPASFITLGAGIGQATPGVDELTGNNNVWLMHFNGSGTSMNFYVNDNGTWRTHGAVNIPTGWHHVVGVADANSTKLYIDGVLISTGAGISGTIVNNPNSQIHFAKDVRFSAGRFGNMSIDEVRIWNRALCAGEIQNNMNCEIPTTGAGLVGNYHFNQGNAEQNNSLITSVTDYSGNNRNASLFNLALNGTTSNWIASGGVISGNTCNPFIQPTATITAGGPTTFCPNGSVTLTANAAASYLWSNNATTQSITVNTTGNYSVVSISSGGCTATSNVISVVVSDNESPVLTVPSNMSSFATSAAGAVVNYDVPTATDNCSVTVSLVSGLASGSTFPIGITTVTYEAKDPSGNSVFGSFEVNVSGLAPQITGPGNISVNTDVNTCGASVSYTAIDNIGIPASTITYSIAPGSYFPTGTTEVTATASNAVGTSSVTFNVTVNDREAPVALTRDITVELDAYGLASIIASQIDNGSNDVCGIASLTISKSTFDCSNVGANTVTLTVTDVNGNVSTNTATVNVLNDLPVINSITASSVVNIAENVFAQAEFTDSNPSSAVWNWGNGVTTNGTIAGNQVTGSYKYPATGMYNVTVTITDICGQTASKTFSYVTIYDPAAGHVTGGGWINAAPGTYIPGSAVSGKVTYGFSAKYTNGVISNDSQLTLTIHDAKASVQSSQIDWLMINGDQAVFAGQAKINGIGGYNFLVSFIDGGNAKRTNPDFIRIIIRNSNGTIVFDNQSGAFDGARATQLVGNGQLVIHTKGSSKAPGLAGESATISSLDLSLNASVNLYPNPVKDVIRISFENFNSNVIDYNLTDISGRKYRINERLELSGNVAEISISELDLPNGIYLLNIRSVDGTTQFNKLFSKE